MSNILNKGMPETATADVTPTPTVTHYQEIAKQVGAGLTVVIAQIPGFEPMHPAAVRFVRANQGFPNDFIATVVAAVEADPQLQSVNKFDVAEARDALQYNEAFRAVIDQGQAFLENLKFTCAVKKARVVASGLQIYQISKGLGRDPGSADVASHARNMRRDIGRPGKRTPKPAAPSPTPQAEQ